MSEIEPKQTEEEKKKEELFKYIETEPHKKRKYEDTYKFNNDLDKQIFFMLPLTHEQRKELYDHCNIFI